MLYSFPRKRRLSTRAKSRNPSTLYHMLACPRKYVPECIQELHEETKMAIKYAQ